MRGEIVKSLFVRLYDRSRIRAFSRRLAERIRDTVRDNVRQHRQGTTGEHYPLTTFPSDAVPRVPFVKYANDWDVTEDTRGFKIAASQPWWKYHQHGATIRAKGTRPMLWKYEGRWFFAHKVVLPRRNPVPGTRALERIIKQFEKEHSNV